MVTKRGKQASRKAAARKYGFLDGPLNFVSYRQMRDHRIQCLPLELGIERVTSASCYNSPSSLPEFGMQRRSAEMPMFFYFTVASPNSQRG
ncbi:MAG: hypothetical protein Q8K59_10455 [Nitrosomonas sp.]|nr:hypothetical protein [Nitrosomonas sp.]MDP1951494.1 hypothetical protein [Nitrosomonas sp.]